MKTHYFVQSFAGVSVPEPFFPSLRRDNIWRCGRTLLTNTIAAQQQTKPNWFSNETKLGFKLLLSRGQQGNLQIFKPHVQSHYFT